jgi:hypothetical protein
MAKELAMVENNEQGRNIRRYLIGVEKSWNNPEAVVQRALQTGQVVRKEALELLQKCARGPVRFPFPGYIGKPPRCVGRSITGKGGRVYALAERKSSRGVAIIIYGPEGELLREGIAARNSMGAFLYGTVEELTAPYEGVIGIYRDCWDWNLPVNDYILWEAARLGNAPSLPAINSPDGAGRKRPEIAAGIAG